MRTSKTTIALAAALGTVALAAPVAPASAHDGAQRDLTEARRATAPFHSIKQARAAGYEAAEACVKAPGVGGMGFHNINPALMDLDLDAAKPELLLYAPKKNGGLKLVGVEYFVPYIGQPAPELFGQRFDGPMAGHETGMPEHYDLHVWLWKKNPNGMFAQFNPTVSCTP